MTYSTEPSSVVAAELPSVDEGGFDKMKRFNSGSTIHHVHETTPDDEFQQVSTATAERNEWKGRSCIS
jgi:hypothetical protein